MIEYKATDIQSIKHLRINYLYEIKLPQELFLEWLVRDGLCFRIYEKSHEIGYFIKSKNDILVEFYLHAEVLTRKEIIFNQILSEYNIQKVYCKSFDNILLTCSHLFAKSSKVIGILFRDYAKGILIDYENQFKIRLARKADIPYLLNFESGLYDTPEELQYTVSNNMLYLFEKDNSLVGCGYLIKVLPEKNYFDIGVWTNPDFRNQGYGSMIISYLKKHCFSHGYTPICGCAVDNIASRKTLENNGFYSKYCIVEFIV